MLLPRLSGGAIGGIVVGSCGFILLLVGLFFWYRWRHRRPGTLPREVLDAELTSDNGNNGGEPDFTNHITPFLYNAVTRYFTSSVAPLPLPPDGGDPPERLNPLSRKMRVWMRERGAQVGAVSREVVVPGPVQNVVMPEEDVRNVEIQAEVVQDVGMQVEVVQDVGMQVEGRVHDLGPISYVSENGEGPPPPDYEQAIRTEPFRTGNIG